MSLKVTVLDEQTGVTQTTRVADGDYVLVTVEPCYVAQTQVLGAAGVTHQVTIKGRAPRPLGPETRPLTHGRHCRCAGCQREDWSRPEIHPRCGFHDADCPKEWAPLGYAGDMVPA